MKFNKNFIILVIAAIVLYLIIMALLFSATIATTGTKHVQII